MPGRNVDSMLHELVKLLWVRLTLLRLLQNVLHHVGIIKLGGAVQHACHEIEQLPCLAACELHEQVLHHFNVPAPSNTPQGMHHESCSLAWQVLCDCTPDHLQLFNVATANRLVQGNHCLLFQ